MDDGRHLEIHSTGSRCIQVGHSEGCGIVLFFCACASLRRVPVRPVVKQVTRVPGDRFDNNTTVVLSVKSIVPGIYTATYLQIDRADMARRSPQESRCKVKVHGKDGHVGFRRTQLAQGSHR